MNLIDFFKRGYILIVDDQMNMRKTIRNMLRVIGIKEFLEAEDGKKALQILEETQSGGGKLKCKFILTDWNMKIMDGPEFVKEVRGNAKFENIPIMMITANPDTSFVTQAIECGVNGYLIKPLTAMTLEKKILNIMEARANPPEHVKLINEGEDLLKQEKYREGLVLLEKALRLSPGSSRILVLLGEVHEKLQSFEKAKKFFEKASELNPNYIKAHTMKAQFFKNRGETSAALHSLEMAAKISPNNSDRQVEIGKIYLGDGKIKKAKSA
ncbi:MAG: response regulator, partial [Nitrospinota bacterium]